MKKPKIKLKVIKEDIGYSAVATIGETLIATQGETFEELRAMVLEVVNLTFEEEGYIYTLEEIQFEYDLESFFAFYKVINAKALAKRIGMNQSLLAQYIRGLKKPSNNQAKRILNGVQKIGRELSEVNFLL